MHGAIVTSPCDNMKMDFPVALDLKVTQKVALSGAPCLTNSWSQVQVVVLEVEEEVLQ